MSFSEKKYSSSPVSKDALIKGSLPMVRRLAFRLARRLPDHIDIDDLISAGMEGLICAANDFDSSKSPSFGGYAELRVRGAMLDELRSQDPATRYARDQQRKVVRAINKIETGLGRTATSEEIAQSLGLSIDEYHKLTQKLARLPAISRAGNLDPDQVVSGQPDPVSELSENELRGILRDALAALPERSQQICALYYQEDCTQAEIGAILGITESRVCQILGESLTRLQAMVVRRTGSMIPPARSTKVRSPLANRFGK